MAARGIIFALLLTGLSEIGICQAASSETADKCERQISAAIGLSPTASVRNYLERLRSTCGSTKGEETGEDPLIEADNALSVISDIQSSKTSLQDSTPLTCYTVPALSDVKRLPETFPWDGTQNGELRIIAAHDEYEAASFVVFSFEDMEKVEFKFLPLVNSEGTSFPTENLDLKVVKVWYQNGNGWYSYFADPGKALVPELLLNDENLIKVDTTAQENYARIDAPSGRKYIWISPPGAIDSRYDEHGYRKFPTFRPLAEPFTDATTLQPVELKAGHFKQFWLTAHVPNNTDSGIYRGQIQVTKAGEEINTIRVALRILPFELPSPKSFDKRDFLVTLYSCPTIPELMKGNGGDRILAEKQLLSMMINMRQHNLLHPMMNYPRGEMLRRHIELMKVAGLPIRPLIGNTIKFLGHGGAPLGNKELAIAKNDAEEWRKFFLDAVSHTDVYLQSGDEPPAGWVAKMRPAWKFYHENGLKIFTAGNQDMFVKGGYVYDMKPIAGFPEQAEKTKIWNAVGHAYIGFYAGQHIGPENPAFVRRQHGLLSYLSGFDMVCNYEFALGPWNDWATDLYKPMALTYPTHDGLVDTIAWEGFREAIDDIRYATKLKELAERAIASGNLDNVYVGRKVLQWLALLDGSSADLNTVRAEMINYIMELNAIH